MQDPSVLSASVRLYDNLHILIERHQKAQQSFNRKLPELTAQHLGYIGLANAERVGGLDLFQAAVFHDRVDFEHKLRLDQMFFGIRYTDIFEHIPASGFRIPSCSCPSPLQSVPPRAGVA